MNAVIMDDRDLDETDIELMNLIRQVERDVNGLLEHLNANQEPAVEDDPEAAYVPGMNIGDGSLYPGLVRRWIAIGTTQLQPGFLALERAVTRKEGL